MCNPHGQSSAFRLPSDYRGGAGRCGTVVAVSRHVCTYLRSCGSRVGVMVTFAQVCDLGYRGVVHLNGCSRLVGTRGGVREAVREYRINGVVKTWKKEVGRWEVPIIWGMRGWDKLTNGNAAWFHTVESCPLLRTKGTVKGVAGAAVWGDGVSDEASDAG